MFVVSIPLIYWLLLNIMVINEQMENTIIYIIGHIGAISVFDLEGFYIFN